MARLYLIIDGYNLLHAAGLKQRRKDTCELERSRDRLLQRLRQELDPGTAKDTTVVFDAHLSVRRDDDAGAVNYGPITVVYSGQGRDADAEIERLLESHSSPKQVLVISSDHRLHKAAARRKARCLDSEEFLTALESPEPPWCRPQSSAAPKSGSSEKHRSSSDGNSRRTAPQGDADYVDEFLQIDVAELKRPVRKEKR